MNVETALHTLGLGDPDHPDEIHGAYRELVKRWHPDLFTHKSELQSTAEERLKQINQAYAILNQHIKKFVDHDKNIIKNNNHNSQDTPGAKGAEPGIVKAMGAWLRKVLAEIGLTCQAGQRAGTPGHHPETLSSRDKAGLNRILRQARNTGQRQPDDAPSIFRRPSLPIHHRRRSNGTRIEGFRTAAPIHPIRRVPRIEPLEGSD